MQSTWIRTLCVSCFGIFFGAIAQAQYCGLSNASINGAYGFVATQGGTAVTATTTGTGTTGTTGTGTSGTGTSTSGSSTTGFSSTNLGQLLGGIAAGNQLATSGVLIFDGAGHVSASSAGTGAVTERAGTYNVNPDCSISVSLSDVFGTNATATQFVGAILGLGAEIDLTSVANIQYQTASANTTGTTSTTGTGTTGTGSTGTGSTGTGSNGSNGTSSTQTASGLSIRLVRTLYQNGCSDSTLKGLYGFVLTPMSVQVQNTSTSTTSTGTGTGTGTSTTTSTNTLSQPTTIIGYVYFNGAGQILSMSSVSPISSTTSSTTTSTTYTALQFSGSYNVNSNCTGSMSISAPNTIGTSTTGTTTGTTGSTGTTGASTASNQTLTVQFVITPPLVSNQGGASNPGLVLSYSDASESGTGYAASE